MQASCLIDEFISWSRKEAAAGRTAPATVDYYRSQLSAWLPTLGLFPPEVEELRPLHLCGGGESRNRMQAVKRLTRWGKKWGHVTADPFADVALPPIGERERVLTREEIRLLYLNAERPWRLFIFLQRHTMCRPGEMRRLTWGMIDLERRLITFVNFKAKNRRKDGVRRRLVPLSKSAACLLRILRRKRNPGPDDLVFKNRRGKQLTTNAVRCAFRRFRTRAGLVGGEQIVSYHLRHTGATNAVRGGLRDRKLADVLGHSSTETTKKYIHLAGDDLVDAIDAIGRPKPGALRKG